MSSGINIIAKNKKARHDFFIEETYEAGISLVGTEVKSIRMGKVNLKDSFAQVKRGELFVLNMHISPYKMGNRFNHDPKRPRRLLLHKSEIIKLYSKVREKGLTLVPTKVYFNRSWIKVEIALAQGKKLYDKRADMISKTVRRETERSLKEMNR